MPHTAGSAPTGAKVRLRLLADRLRASLWPIPLAMLLVALAVLQLTRAIDEHLSGPEALRWWWLHSGSGDDARNLLSTLASSIITLAGVVFSMTLVTLSLAANQFGSRLVLSYIRDRRTKLSLGFFVLTIVYCMLALRVVTHEMSPADVPHVTVTTGLALSIACVLILVLYMHVVARSIVADEVTRRVAAQLHAAIEPLPPLDTGAMRASDANAALPADAGQGGQVLKCGTEGYIEEIDHAALVNSLAAAGLHLRLTVAAGDYMCRGGLLGHVYPARQCTEELMGTVQQAIVLGAERTPVQDPAFAIRHLVDVALRALSPGINDPNTALVVIDRLRGALSILLERSLPATHWHDEAGELRLVCRSPDHADLLAAALHPIRDSAATQPLVMISLLQALARLTEHVRTPRHADMIQAEADQVLESAMHHPPTDSHCRGLRSARLAVADKLAEARRRCAHGDSAVPDGSTGV